MTESTYLSLYQAGKEAFERGNYRQSIEYLESATKLVSPSSLQGGESQIWLVTAYQASNRVSEALSLARELTNHPFLDIRKQSKQILYILEAPRLQRPAEWMTEIPDLTSPQENKLYQTKAIGQSKPIPKKPTPETIPYKYPQNNSFIWVALAVSVLLLVAIVYLRY